MGAAAPSEPSTPEAPPDTDGRGTPSTLGPGARARRLLAAGVVGAVLLAGSLVGSDDWFPLGPFRMYTNRAGPSGIVRTVAVEAVDADGEPVRVHGGDVGLRHAELESQLHRFRDDPELLGAVAEAWSSVHPDRPPLVEVRLEERIRRVVDRVVQDEVEERTVAEWVSG
jgi:hypothetical protein